MFLDRLGDEFIQQFDKFILGSKSPQRFEIFNQMGVINALTQHRFFIIPSQFKEDLDKTQFAKPQDYVLETATQKALALEKSLLLQLLDQLWKEHLLTLDHLRQGIGLRAYGQRDPLNEYKSEAFSLFDNLVNLTLREKKIIKNSLPLILIILMNI